jgi:hypothetical protein
MLQPEIILETVEIMKTAIGRGLVNLSLNNRAGGKAPWMPREIAGKFWGQKEPKVSQHPGLGDR